MSEFETLKAATEHVDALVEHWFFEAFHGSPVARSTEVWNIVHAAKEDLKRRLAEAFAELPPPKP